MSGISDKAINKLSNQNKFNGGVELEEDYGVNLYSTFYRQYDPQVGRFGGVDIMSEQTAGISGYQFSGNNPISFNDPMGNKYQDPLTGNTWHHANGLLGNQGIEIPGLEVFGGGHGGGGRGDYSAFWNSALPVLMGLGGPDANVNVTFKSTVDRYGNNVTLFRYFSSIDNGYGSTNGEVITNQIAIKNPGENCNTCLDPSTIGHNLLYLSYPGGNNPQSNDRQDNFSYIPLNPAEYPAIGHDRRYDNLGAKGIKGLLSDPRAIGADWQFVGEELAIAASTLNPEVKADALILGIGLGVCSFTKTLVQLSKGPVGVMEIVAWYNFSTQGVTNNPSPR